MDTLGILTLLLSVFAMITALASVWFSSETIKKANSANKQFYEANVKGMVKTLEGVARASVEAADKIERLENVDKAEGKDFLKIVTRRIQDVEDTVSELRTIVDKLEKYVPGNPKQMNF